MSKKNYNRESAKEQGFYDGRFREKVVKDKKKENKKKWARLKKRNSTEC